MAKQGLQKQKLLALAQLLLRETDEAHPLTMQQLLDALDAQGIAAERKSVYDDIEVLRGAGLDILLRRDAPAGYYIAAREFQLAELKLLVDAVQASRFITERKSMELIRKLENLASRHEAGVLQRQVYVAGRVKTMNESIYYTVDRLHDAISNNRKIRFQYFAWNEKGETQLRHDGRFYCVSPFALSWDDENYYLLAYDAAAALLKHYRVDKMVCLTVTDEAREGVEQFSSFDTAAYTRKVFGMYGGQEALVTLRCASHLAGVMLDRFGQEVLLRPHGDGTFSLTAAVIVSTHFLTWLMNFPGEVEIEEPQTVRDAYLAHAQKISDCAK